MNRLDNKKIIGRLDSQGMVHSIESLALQCQQAWDDVKNIKIPKNYRQVDNILINGMGGSALGGHVLESLFGKDITIPLKVTNSYTVPGFVNKKTLCLMSSYSGTTEEVLASLTEARNRQAKIIIICAGGRLAQIAKRYNIPAYVFDPRFNPSNQPRMGVGYSLVGIISLLRQAGLLKISDKEFEEAVTALVKLHRPFGTSANVSSNPAKKTAMALSQRVPVIITAEHLSGNAHIMANQINENGKNFSTYFLISEMNHHLLEGLIFPRNNTRSLMFVFLESRKFRARNIRRFSITKKVLRSHQISYVSYLMKTGSPLAQVFESLLFGSYVSFYLSVLNNLDPSPIPVVDYFKKQLSR
ncbi:SIS domain-containing protein [Patescibacteria group bacterium]|nr:SIS domain-containing protein [Patescibacteria group bacterium]